MGKIQKRFNKSRTWSVAPITQCKYEVRDFEYVDVVDISNWTCTCNKWQKSGLPCGHVIRAASYNNMEDCSEFAHTWFKADRYRATYHGEVYPPGNPNQWERPDEVLIVKPPVMDKRPTGRPRNIDRIPSYGEEPIQKLCSRCKRPGHTRLNCPTPTPAQSNLSGLRGSGSQRASDRRGQESSVCPTFNLNE